jgi:alkylhydroperoxidase family enzyme
MLEHAQPGPYTLINLGRAMASHAPAVMRGIPQAVAGFRGAESLGPHTRIAIQLRLARLLGCPVCRALFPAIGRKAGLTEAFMRAALDGEPAGLTPEAAAALAWVDEVVRSGGAPGAPVAPATELTVVQRDHLVVMTRLDIIIHSIGLMFLPHSLVTRAWAD